MSLPSNLVRLGVLLFSFGAVTGLLLAASFGTRVGTVFGLFLVIVALGMLLQSNMTENDEDDEKEEDDEEPERLGDASLRSVAQIIHGLITGSAFFWASWPLQLISLAMTLIGLLGSCPPSTDFF